MAAAAASLVHELPLEGQSTVSWGTVTGQVFDGAGLPVGGAVVTVENTGSRAVTDAAGRFEVEQVSPGTHRVRVDAVGYAPGSAEALVRPGGTVALDVQLTEVVTLGGLTVEATRLPGSTAQAPDVLGGLVLAGTGNTIIELAGLPANLAEKSARQIYARVPGAFVYDMDGSGNQVNVSTRGLDPHRSWELNVRQDGVLLNSDLYGYPASHYSPPMEAIERLEVIRGTAALQYGSQYGGMVNYVTKGPRTDGAIGAESINTLGSFGLRSTFNAVGGSVGRLSYYGYMNERRSDGYRQGSESDFEAQYLAANFAVSPEVTLRGQVGRTAYTYRIPGPLTDQMFAEDPRQSTRSRNYYQPDITAPALSLSWQRPSGMQLTATASAILGPRNSVQYLGFADQPDEPDSETGEFGARQVDIDRFRSLTFETCLV